MKITNTSDPLGIKPGTGAESRNRSVRSTDKIESPATAAPPVRARQVPAGETPFNAEQVERIKTAIRNGEFQIDAEAVADKLLQIEADLLRGA